MNAAPNIPLNLAIAAASLAGFELLLFLQECLLNILQLLVAYGFQMLPLSGKAAAKALIADRRAA
jgi:hypothetical protein